MFFYGLYDRLFILVIVSILTLIVLKKYILKFNLKFFMDRDFKKPQAFHKKEAFNIGGLLILIFFFFSLIIFKPAYLLKSIDPILATKVFNIIQDLVIALAFIFVFSVLEDIKIKIKPHLRLLIFFFLVMGIVFFLNLKVYSIQFYLFDVLLKKNYIISLIFTTLCILFIINGSNFIDGFNGLLAIHSIIIISVLAIINFSFGSIDLLIICYLSLTILIIYLFFNFPNATIFLGNSGSYIVGFIISFLILKTSEYTEYHKVYPFFFSILLYYLFFEVFFSFFRKIVFEKKNPLYPDKKHLHMLLYGKLKSNSKTSIVINFFYFLSILPLIFIKNFSGLLKMYFVFLIVFYLIFYFRLLKNYKN